MKLANVRALLAILTLVAVVVAAGLAFFLGPELSEVQLTLLTMLLTLESMAVEAHAKDRK